MYNTNVTSAVGKAWALHRNGDNDQAAKEFERLLSQNADDLDANFGLGLVLKALGSKDKALTTFQKTVELTAKGLSEKPGDDRLMMLRRMSQQRIAEINKLAAD